MIMWHWVPMNESRFEAFFRIRRRDRTGEERPAGAALAEVRDAAGQANVSITSAYKHVAVDDEGVGNLFGAI